MWRRSRRRGRGPLRLGYLGLNDSILVHRLAQFMGQRQKYPGRRGVLVDENRILAGHLFDFRNCTIDLTNSAGLLASR